MRHQHWPTALSVVITTLPILLAGAACDGSPLGAPETIGSGTNGDAAASIAATNGPDDFDAQGVAIPFADAEVFFEFNTTDDDLGLQIFLDAEDWRRVRVSDPSGKDIVDITARHALSELGITELRFESAEPSPAEVLDLFGPGTYTFSGRTVDGERLESTAALSNQFAAAADFSPSDGEIVDMNAAVVTWSAPGAEQVEIIIENTSLGHALDVIVDASTTSLDLPAQFLTPNTEYKIEILAIAANGNKTIAESTFVTMN